MNRDEVEERLRAAYKNGVSLQSICSKTGLRLGKVASIIPREGERNPYRVKARLSDEEINAINSAIDEIKAAL